MPRKKLINTSEFPYHITARSNNKDWFYTSKEILWEMFLDQFSSLSTNFNFSVHAFVLMDNHYHLICSTSEKYPIGFILQRLQKNISNLVNQREGRCNHFWGGPYKGSLIMDGSYFANCYKYVLRNPIEAGLSERVEQYSFSISSLDCNLPANIGLTCHLLGKSFLMKKKDILIWFNSDFEEEHKKAIQKGLKKTIFTCRDRKSRLDIFNSSPS